MARSFCPVTIRLKDVSRSPPMTLESTPFALGPTPPGGLEGTGWYASVCHSNSSSAYFPFAAFLLAPVYLAFHDLFTLLCPLLISHLHSIPHLLLPPCSLTPLLHPPLSPVLSHFVSSSPHTLTHTVLSFHPHLHTLLFHLFPACTFGPTNRGAGSQLS